MRFFQGKFRAGYDPFVSRASNAEIDRLFAYHERTKHSWASVRADAHFLDWELQPSPFRTYDGVPAIELARGSELAPDGTRATLRALANPPPRARRLDRATLSTLLWHSVAISRWKQVRGTAFRYSLRVNPSSGNLHPTETHVALPELADLPAGLFHYRARDHRLEQRGRGDAMGALLATAMVAFVRTVGSVTLERAELPPDALAVALLVGVGVTLAAALEPARRASRIQPVEALKSRLDLPAARSRPTSRLRSETVIDNVLKMRKAPANSATAAIRPVVAWKSAVEARSDVARSCGEDRT